MGLEDFERELAENKVGESKHRSHRHRSEDGEGRHHHRHHHRSHRPGEEIEEDRQRHRHKRRHDREEDNDEEQRRHRKQQRSDSPKPETKSEEVKVFNGNNDGEEDEWVEKQAMTAPPEEDNLDQRDRDLKQSQVQRDAWMQEPSALDIDYVASRKPKPPPSQFVGAKDSHEMKMHGSKVHQHLADLQRDLDSNGDDGDVEVEDEPAQHQFSYTFGDSASSWRMTKLKAVYRQAEETARSIDDVALERYGGLRDFDDAREEEREMDRRKMYGKEYVGLEKPSGELFQERRMKAGLHRESSHPDGKLDNPKLSQAAVVPEVLPPATTAPLDQTALNKLKAQMMKAKLRNAPHATELEEQYNLAASASLANLEQTDVIVLNDMDNRQLAGGRKGEVTAVNGKRGQERGLVTENEDMTIDDMVRQERRTRGLNGGEGRAFAERIARDARFVNDLDYMDDNAAKLSKKVVKSDVNLRNTAISDFQKMQRVLESCPLCHHEDSSQPTPTAPIVSLATRTYLTLPTEPEVARGGAVIVPIQHHLNLLECDEDEWEEIRNFMKSLTRHFAAQEKGVIFYENAAHFLSHKRHATLTAIPLPRHLAETASAYFKEAIIASDEQWSQHKPIIDTLALSQKANYGKKAFQRAMVKELPYFHVWFTLDGGLGHVIEDERRWPRGDLFAREIVGGMLDAGPEVVKKQGRWERGDRRVEGFNKKWEKWDWTSVLMDR